MKTGQDVARMPALDVQRSAWKFPDRKQDTEQMFSVFVETVKRKSPEETKKYSISFI
jgi:hypothetical protein